VIRDRTVVACDEDGARLDEPLEDGRRLLRWDEIARGKVAEAQQGTFDQLLEELGLPLLRLRQRLKTRDYRALLEPAQQLAPRFRERKSDAAYLVVQSLMWGALANGEREAALAPYLRALELLRTHAADAKRLPGERRLAFDPQTGLSPELLTLWCDRDAAREALPHVRDAITAMSTPRPEATRLYFGTLALVAGDEDTAGKMLDGWNPEARSLAELRRIALAQREVQAGMPGAAVAALKTEGTKLLPENRALAEYWLARATGEPQDSLARQDAALDLLAIAARHGTSQPAVSAAAIDRARPTCSGASVNGKNTVFRTGRTASWLGSFMSCRSLGASRHGMRGSSAGQSGRRDGSGRFAPSFSAGNETSGETPHLGNVYSASAAATSVR
jgi:hypothetical protein